MKKVISKIQNGGFTLVELMVVVAIIGILSAIAIPNFKKYQAKSKTSEAKIQLSALYMAETSTYTDYDAYGTCLNHIGFDPSLEVNNRYYAVGFSADGNAANALIDNAGGPDNCDATGAIWTTGAVTDSNSYYAYAAGKKVAGKTPVAKIDSGIANAEVKADGTEFMSRADGIISKDGVTDSWSMNHNKDLNHVQVGY